MVQEHAVYITLARPRPEIRAFRQQWKLAGFALLVSDKSVNER